MATLDRPQILDIVCASLESVNQERPETDRFRIDEATALLGDGSPLDSLEFVAFSTDLERRLRRVIGRDPGLLGDAFLTADQPFDTVTTLVGHILTKLGG